MFFSLGIPALVYGVMALTIPESPRYLVAKRDHVKAAAVLRRFVGGDVPAKIAEIAESLQGKREKATFSVLRRPGGKLLPIVWVGILLSVFQQFTGINVIFYYSSTLWQAVGFTEKDALAVTVITSVTNIVTTLVAIALIDRVGRKPLLLIGAAGQAVCLMAMAIVFGLAPLLPTVTSPGKAPELLPHLGATAPIALVAANLYVVFFGCSWGPVVWVMLGEMFNNRIRAMALAVAASAQWVANFIVSTTFPPLKAVGLGLAYGIYALFGVLATLFVIKFVKETKGKELEEMV
jgi:sugar porter (SP) family MFS transporter